MSSNIQSARLAAFHNVVARINVDARLPEQVFSGPLAEYLFFESDWLFGPCSVQIAQDLMKKEGAESCCLLNFSRTHVLEYQAAATIFIEKSVSNEQYDAWLRSGGPASGWLYARERYGLASDGGEWCIYCETNNDVAVIGLQTADGSAKYSSVLRTIHAKPILTHLREGTSATFPFSDLTSTWRAALIEHYGNSAAHDLANR